MARQSTHVRGADFLALMSWLALACVSVSCSGSSDNAGNPVQSESAVDPRFATAESLLDFYNQVSTTGPVVNAQVMVDLTYAESAKQEQLLRIYQHMLKLADLDQACWDVFGHGFDNSTESALAPYQQRAIMKEQSAERALAEHRDNKGDVEQIHLVKIGERWWVSGYTLEYAPEFQTEASYDDVERVIGYMAAAAPDVIADVKKNRWPNAAADGPKLAKLALVAYIQRRFPETVENPELLDY